MADSQTERVTLTTTRADLNAMLSGRRNEAMTEVPTSWLRSAIPEDSDQPRLREALRSAIELLKNPQWSNAGARTQVKKDLAAALEAPPEESWRCPNCDESYPRPTDPGNVWCPGDCGVKLVPPEDSVTGGVEGARNIELVETLDKWGASKDQEGVIWLTVNGCAVLDLSSTFRRAASPSGGVELERLADELDARAEKAGRDHADLRLMHNRARAAGSQDAFAEAASLLRESQGVTDRG